MRWVPLVLLCGCTAAFGIDEIPPPAPVTGSIVHRFLNLDASFRPQLEVVPYAATDRPIEVRHASGALADVSWQPAQGTFSFQADAGETYRVLVTTAGLVTEYQTSSAQLAIAATELGHPDETAPGAGAELDFMPDKALSGDGRVATSGVWMTGPGGSLTPLMMPLTMLAPHYLQARALPRAAVHDQVHLFDYSGSIPMFEGVASVDVAATTPTMVPVTMQPSTLACATFATHHSTDLARLKQLYPEFSATEGQSVTIVASAKPEIGLTGNFLEGVSTIIDDSPTVQYGVTPSFSLMSTLVVSAAAISRGTQGISLYAFLHHYHLITPQVMCGAAVIDEDEIALATAPRLANVALTTDGQTITVAGTAPVELAFDLDGTRASAFEVMLYRISNGVPVYVRTFFSTEPKLLLDPMTFDPGMPYLFDIAVLNGLPDAAAGDFRDLVYPSARGDLFTPVFSIAR